MTTDISQMNLQEPLQVDWSTIGGSGYTAPPPALDGNGKPIIYQGIADISAGDPDQGYLNYLLDPIRIKGLDATIRFTRVSTKPYMKNGEPMKGNPNRLAQFLRACGLQAKPQTNSEYAASVNAVKGKQFSFTVDWEAYNKDTQERIKGYLSFPEDPERPGQRKSILKAGDVVTERDNKGNVLNTLTVKSDILFANAKLKFFQDATPKAVKVG